MSAVIRRLFALPRRFSGVARDAPVRHNRAVKDVPGVVIRRLDSIDEDQIQGLAELLVDSVEDDAGVGFMFPLELATAEAFWRGIASGVATGARALLVAEDETGIVGTVQLLLAQPENQPHRADLAKMMVLRRARRRGIGAALMLAAEDVARTAGKTLLVLDTWSGSDAGRLYTRLGWVRVGEIPGFALMARGGLWGTTVYYRELG